MRSKIELEIVIESAEKELNTLKRELNFLKANEAEHDKKRLATLLAENGIVFYCTEDRYTEDFVIHAEIGNKKIKQLLVENGFANIITLDREGCPLQVILNKYIDTDLYYELMKKKHEWLK